MPLDAVESAPHSATQEFIAYLRAHPQSALLPASELAHQFGLTEEFVRDIQTGLQRLGHAATSEPKASFSWAFLSRGNRRLKATWTRLTDHPERFIFLSIGFTAVILWALSVTFPSPPASVMSRGSRQALTFSETGPLEFILVLGVLAAHLGCYYRHAMSRYALAGAVMVWFATSVPFMISVWSSAVSATEPERFGLVMLASAGMLVMGMLYAGIGSLAAVAGGYFQSRAEERAEESLSRQELLERYFELEGRLARSSSSAEVDWSDTLPIGNWIRKYPLPFAGLTALGISILATLAQRMGGLGPEPKTEIFPSPVQAVFVLVQVGLLIGNAALFAAFGLFSRSSLTSFGMWAVASVTTTASGFLPGSEYGAVYYQNPQHIISMGFILSATLAITMLAHLGGRLQRRSARRRSLQHNDQASIVSEMLRIQWRLADNTSTVCVMVVDAAKSSEMKLSSDSLVVEYSFREYQEWLSEISRDLGGRVHSTAGDGAVIAFPTCLNAFHAARQIQTDLHRFNQEVNRLSMPFRLRIGLHVGEVPGNLDEVEFTEVIDIAAHMQGVAPISGIAVSDRVAMSIPGEDFVPLAQEVDGHRVLLAMNPIEG